MNKIPSYLTITQRQAGEVVLARLKADGVDVHQFDGDQYLTHDLYCELFGYLVDKVAVMSSKAKAEMSLSSNGDRAFLRLSIERYVRHRVELQDTKIKCVVKKVIDALLQVQCEREEYVIDEEAEV